MKSKHLRRFASWLAAFALLLGLSVCTTARAAGVSVQPIATATSMYSMSDGTGVYATTTEGFLRVDDYTPDGDCYTLGLTYEQYGHLLYGMTLAQRALAAGPAAREDDILLPAETRLRDMGPMLLQQLFWQGLHEFNPNRYAAPDVEPAFTRAEIAFFFDTGTLSDGSDSRVRLNKSSTITSVGGIVGPLKLTWSAANADITMLQRTGGARTLEPAYVLASGGACDMVSSPIAPYQYLREVRVGQTFYLLYRDAAGGTVSWQPRVPVLNAYGATVYTSAQGDPYVAIDATYESTPPSLAVTSNPWLDVVADVSKSGADAYDGAQDMAEGQAYEFRANIHTVPSGSYDIVIGSSEPPSGTTAQDAIPIYTPYQFTTMLAKEENKTKYFKLMNDLEMSSNITEFGGTLDGQGHTIYGQQSHLFTELSGTVTDLHFVDAGFNATLGEYAIIAKKVANTGRIENCSVQGDFVGALFSIIAFSSDGTIRNCRVYNSTLKDCDQQTLGIGGIVYYSYGLIENCVFEDSSIISKRGSVGGIANTAQGAIRDCIVRNVTIESAVFVAGGIVATASYGNNNLGPVRIVNCRVESSVTLRVTRDPKEYTIFEMPPDRFNIGGIAGYAYDASIESCAFYGTIEMDANVHTERNYIVGGIVAYQQHSRSRSRITRCLFDGRIRMGCDACLPKNVYAGGIAHESEAPIDNCEVRGSIDVSAQKAFVGGIVGMTTIKSGASNTIANNIYNGTIAVTHATESTVGGIAYDAIAEAIFENNASLGSISVPTTTSPVKNILANGAMNGTNYYAQGQSVRIGGANDPSAFQGTEVPVADLQGASATLAAAGFAFGSAWQANTGAYPTVHVDDPALTLPTPAAGTLRTRQTDAGSVLYASAMLDGVAIPFDSLSYSVNGGARTPVPAQGIGLPLAKNGGTLTLYYTASALNASQSHEGVFRVGTINAPAFLRVPEAQTSRSVRLRVVRTGEDMLVPLEGSAYALERYAALPASGAALGTQAIAPGTASDTVPYAVGSYARLAETTAPDGYGTDARWMYAADAANMRLCDANGAAVADAPLGFRTSGGEILYTYYARGALLPGKNEVRALTLQTVGGDGTPISGAKYDLYRLASSTDAVGERVRGIDMSHSDAAEPVRLRNGWYRIVQTQAPAGCDVSAEALRIECTLDEMAVRADASHAMRPRSTGAGGAYTVVLTNAASGTSPSTPTTAGAATPTPTPPIPSFATPTPPTYTLWPGGSTPAPGGSTATPTPTPTPTATPTPTPTATPTPTNTPTLPPSTPTPAPSASAPPIAPVDPQSDGKAYAMSYELFVAKVNDTSVSGSAIRVKPGDVVTLAARMRNQGTLASKPKSIAFATSPGLTCVEPNATSVGGQWFFSYVGDVLPPGAQVERNVRFRVEANSTDDQRIWMEGGKLIDALGAEHANAVSGQRAELSLSLKAPYDVALTESVYAVNGSVEAAKLVNGLVRVRVGDVVTFLLHIKNNGSMAARPDVLYVDPPSGMTFDEASNPGWKRVDGRLAYAYTHAALQPGESITVYLQMTITRSVDRMTMSASIDGIMGEDGGTVHANAGAGRTVVSISIDTGVGKNGFGEMAKTGEALPVLPGLGALLMAGAGAAFVGGWRRRKRARRNEEGGGWGA